MYVAFVSAGTSAGSARLLNVGILILLVVIAWPLFGRLRRSLSENRKRRWVEEGLMDPPAADPQPSEPTDESR